MEEVYKIIPDTNDLYEASNLGNIRRVVSYVSNQPNGRSARKVGGVVLKPKTKSNGYKEVRLAITPQVGKMFYVHRAVVSAFLGEIPEGMVVNHKDGVKVNNNLSNLEITTHSENVLHSYRVLGRKNNSSKGEHHSLAKVTEQDVIRIRQMYDSGVKSKLICDEYSSVLTLSAVRKICYRASWKHLP